MFSFENPFIWWFIQVFDIYTLFNHTQSPLVAVKNKRPTSMYVCDVNNVGIIVLAVSF